MYWRRRNERIAKENRAYKQMQKKKSKGGTGNKVSAAEFLGGLGLI